MNSHERHWSGFELRQARKAAGLTQADLAERLDIRLWLVDQWESGAREIPSERGAQLVTALGLEAVEPSPDELPLREEPNVSTMATMPDSTPVDLGAADFPRALRGYEPDAVHARLGELEARASRLASDLVKERIHASELQERLRVAGEPAEPAGAGPDVREEETLLRDTLMTAQKAANDVREQARREAAEITETARRGSEQLVKDAEAERTRLMDEIRRLEEHVETSRAAVRAFLNSLLEQVDARPDLARDEAEETFDHELLKPSARSADVEPAEEEPAVDPPRSS